MKAERIQQAYNNTMDRKRRTNESIIEQIGKELAQNLAELFNMNAKQLYRNYFYDKNGVKK